MTKALLEFETIDADQIGDIMSGKPPRPPKPSGAQAQSSRRRATPAPRARPRPQRERRTLIAGRFEFALERPLIMGVVNITPDLFRRWPLLRRSGGADAGARLADEGADIIDIGGESTRSGPSWFQRTKSCVASCPCSRSSTAFASRWTADGRKS